MAYILDELVADLRSSNPSQRSVDLASTFLMSISCFYKGHPMDGTVSPLIPVSEVDVCSLVCHSDYEFQALEVGKNFPNAPMCLSNERILFFSYYDNARDATVANSIIQTPNEQGLFLPSGHVDFEFIAYWLGDETIQFTPNDPTASLDAEGWDDNHPLPNGVIYSSKGFTYTTQPKVLADYLEAIEKVDGGFGGVIVVLDGIAKYYDKYFN